MSLYNQILAYIEGENAPAHDSSHGPNDGDKNDGGEDSPPESPSESLPNDSPESLDTSSPEPSPKPLPNDSHPHGDESHGGKDGDKNMLVTGGKLLSETVDNLTGGGMGKKESVKTPPPVKKDVDPNLFEGGAVLVTDRSEARNVEAKMNENGVRGRYTEFLHRLRTPKLFSGGSVNHASEDASESLVTHDSDTTIDGGNIDVLPVFPYLIRY